tara:strand:- start:6 stop:1160 length:1155 start_codon:yes stop_codon:yes gene_type:complete
MIALIYLGKKIRKSFPAGVTFTQFIFYKLGKNLFKSILLLSIFYMFIFLCAEITAVAMLINWISGTSLWITAALVLITTLFYTLYGGLRASILTDNFQFFIIIILLLVCMYNIFSLDFISYNSIMNRSDGLLSSKYIPNYTAGLTFFIAVAATNLFHQGNWQRVFAAKNYDVLNKSLKLSFLIIIPIIFFMGITGIIAISVDGKVNPDLAFFSILLKDKSELLYMGVIILAVSLTVSTIDTLVNAISSLIVVDGKKINKNLRFPNAIVILLSIIAFFVASKGFSILYLFLIADLLCCAAVFPVFYGFYRKNFDEINAIKAILLGLILGLLIFPSPDFTQSLLIGTLLPFDLFPKIISSSLLFWSFLIATISPVIVIMSYDSFKR